VKRDVMFFWGHHCHGKFDAPTICYALDRGREDVEPELGSLVEAGIVDRQLEDGVVFYSLTRNEERRRPIVERAGPGHPGN
jgi:DNA-binding transcriptional ArsR family regulator